MFFAFNDFENGTIKWIDVYMVFYWASNVTTDEFYTANVKNIVLKEQNATKQWMEWVSKKSFK